jgi:cob(I)alamin adenosyltransferase
MRIYTKLGDEGETQLFGGKQISKTDPRAIAIGTVDELNASIGVVRTELDSQRHADLVEMLEQVQWDLFVVGGDLATLESAESRSGFSVPRITEDAVGGLEARIDAFEEELPPLKAFILPGGTRVGAQLHVARTVCRRAERSVVAVAASDTINATILAYLNRLSDLLFMMARVVNRRDGVDEVEWRPRDASDAGA